MTEFINEKSFIDLEVMTAKFKAGQPFNHIVIDNFWRPEIAQELVAEFPEYDSNVWTAHYHNPLEDKKACNHWDRFPKTTYQAFDYLNGDGFTNIVEHITDTWGIKNDIGLHGGGWHCHHKGGKLNIHLDYSIHPKLKLERHFNLIIYMTPNWNPKWGGGLELWGSDENGSPSQCITTVENKFNRAVIFDTTQNSWHGLPEQLNCPEGINRQSLAIYYLTDPASSADPRPRALYAPHKEQANDPEILEFIEKRARLSK
jgi:hypothetical protein